jgi:haloacetate dehalogenase
MLVLWGAKGKIGNWYDALAIWRKYCAAEVTGGEVADSGHYIPEEAPQATLDWFARFFG